MNLWGDNCIRRDVWRNLHLCSEAMRNQKKKNGEVENPHEIQTGSIVKGLRWREIKGTELWESEKAGNTADQLDNTWEDAKRRKREITGRWQ